MDRARGANVRGLSIFVLGALCGAIGVFYFLGERSWPDAVAALAPPPSVAIPEPPPGESIAVEPNSEPSPAHAGSAEPGATVAPQTDTAQATPPPAAEAPVAPVVTAPETPAERSVTPNPVAPEPMPPPAAAEESAVATPIADSYQAHPGALMVPVTGIAPNQLTDTFEDMRGADRRHEAMDIMAPVGTPVIAVDDGKVVKLFNSVRGGLTVYQFDPTEKLAYYYAHLDSYAPGVVEGVQLKRGDLVGHVGISGNSHPTGPHLHFAVFELDPEKRWWKGTAINPYPLFKR